MKCKNCGVENPNDAKFCRGCGKNLNKSGKNFSNILFWISLVVSGYCLISVLFPIKRETSSFLGKEYLCYFDPFGINPEGESYYMQEWMSALIVASLVTLIFYWIMKRCS